MAMLTRWDPFRDLARLQDEMNRLFEERTPIKAGESVGWTPLADIYEDDDALTLRFELAGVDPAHVQVRSNRVTAGDVQLRVTADGRWWRYERRGRTWELVEAPSTDPTDLVGGD